MLNITKFQPRIPTAQEAQDAIPEHLRDAAQRIASNARAGNTARAYEADWRKFDKFCRDNSFPPLPTTEAALIAFLTHLTEMRQKRATILRCVSAISVAHKRQGVDIYTPRVTEFLKGVRRSTDKSTGKRALTVEDIRRMVTMMPASGSNIAYRDRALILFGFSSAMRRGELCDLVLPDLVRSAEGFSVYIRRSKTDQEARGYWMPIEPGKNPETCPVRAMDAWLAVRKALGCEGPFVFVGVKPNGVISGKQLDEKEVARRVKHWAKAAGLNDADVAAHSLRSGHATSALAGGADLQNVKENLRHRNIETTEIYDQRTVRPRKVTSAKLGL